MPIRNLDQSIKKFIEGLEIEDDRIKGYNHFVDRDGNILILFYMEKQEGLRTQNRIKNECIKNH